MNYKVSFRGDGKTLFKIWITNLLLTICTLGIYYPWARANMKKYLYSSTYLGDYSFEFHGTGRQMFFGLVKFLLIISVLIFILGAIYAFIPAKIAENPLFALSFDWLALIPYVPVLALFIHGSRRYSMSRTSYRGIRFGYRGDKKSLVLLMCKGALFTLLTLGIYYPWLVNDVRKYIYGNTRFGNVKLEFNGKGLDYFGKLVCGLFLCYFTVGIFYFLYKKGLFKFFYENLSFSNYESVVKIKTSVTGGKVFKLLSVNWLLILFTLGLGYPFAKVRSMRFLAENLELHGDMDLDNVIQTEENYTDATGDAEDSVNSSGDFFDMDIF